MRPCRRPVPDVVSPQSVIHPLVDFHSPLDSLNGYDGCRGLPWKRPKHAAYFHWASLCGDDEPMTDADQAQLTQLLRQVNSGEDEALAQLMPVVYSELRRQAARYLRRERQNHTLQPTALVNEAFIKLIDQKNVRWQNRAHFFGIAAQAMRRIMVDHARARHRVKRGGVQQAVTLDEAMIAEEARSVDVLALDEALTRLAAIDARQARIVELRYFAELSVEETSEVVGVSPATVKREWAMARAWLHSELTR